MRKKQKLKMPQVLKSNKVVQIPANRVVIVAESPKTFYQLVESKIESRAFNKTRLRGFLNYYGSYPAQYRTLIWRFLFKLPENRGGYEALLDQGTHPSYRDFRKKFPLKSDRLAKSMERIVSSLAFWSPIFENLEYLPSLVFPFVKLFIGDLFSCLEVVITVLSILTTDLVNWCQKWWEYYPNPPIECLDLIEQLLKYHDKELYDHFEKCQITSQTYAWLIMQSFFSELFSKDDWLKLWDHLVTNQPSFFYYVLVAYLIRFRQPLLETSRLADFEYFFRRRNAVTLNQVIVQAYTIQDATPSRFAPASFLSAFSACPVGEYPVFNKYPEFIVNYQSKMKDKIRQEENEYIRKRRTVEDLTRLTEALRKDKAAWDTADWNMNDMVEQWWDHMLTEEDKQKKRNEKLQLQETGKAAAAMDVIAQVRQSFVEGRTDSTEKHIAAISKIAGKVKHNDKQHEERKELDNAFQTLETEWKQRRQDLIMSRKDLSNLQENRMSR